MLVGLEKFFIEKNFPLRVHQLTMAMGHERLIWALAACIYSRKVLE